MTTELAMMNKEAVAIAADSAATVQHPGGQKVFQSANKIFALSRHHPVGIMVYGGAEFMGIPWETLIKNYRRQLGTRKFARLRTYADGFLKFLSTQESAIGPDVQKDHVEAHVDAMCRLLRDNIVRLLKEEIKEKGSITQQRAGQLVAGAFAQQARRWRTAPFVKGCTSSRAAGMTKRYKQNIQRIVKRVFEEVPNKLPLSRRARTDLLHIVSSLFVKFPSWVEHSGVSGLVVTGFGDEEVFPHLISFSVDGLVQRILSYRQDHSVEVDQKNTACVLAFAQKQMVSSFMEGVDPVYQGKLEQDMSVSLERFANLITDAIIKGTPGQLTRWRKSINRQRKEFLSEYIQRLRAFRHDEYVRPVVSVLSLLPKDEMAAMAESLVNLTSMKHRMSMETETVAGPIDVAVISKADGFVWIKRKHYFRPELNPAFIAGHYNRPG